MHLRRISLILLAVFAISAAALFAIDTTDVQLRDGATADGAVSIVRDDGHLVFDDAHSPATTLSALRANTSDHGALTGLGDDDHTQYHTAARHTAAHDATFNNALSVTADPAGNSTLGAHTADARIHADRTAAEAIPGAWNFSTALDVRGGAIRLGLSQFAALPALRFDDGANDAELTWSTASQLFAFNRTVSAPTLRATSSVTGLVGGVPTATLSGFASIEGIAAADLVSSTADETISGDWLFANDAEVSNTLTARTVALKGLHATTLEVANGTSTPIAAGSAVVWHGLGAARIEVAALTGAMGSGTAFAGIAVDAADEDDVLRIVVRGVATAAADAGVSAGDAVMWDGSQFATGTPRVGFALEGASGGVARVWVE